MISELAPVLLQRFSALFRCLDRDRDGAVGLGDYVALAGRFATALGWDAVQAKAAEERRAQAFARLVGEAGEPSALSLSAFVQACAREAERLRGGGAVELRVWMPELATLLERDPYAIVTHGDFTAYLAAVGSDADPMMVFQRLDRDDDGALIFGDVEALAREYFVVADAEVAGAFLLCGKI